MSSLIEGYNYDIFISYRQKDNKGDRWVSEFVEALKTELESTFKEDISVYFDINPHDGLLETHDVDASLQDKLKCLIFIPIISRTYCDPKSFAWEHEFRAFIKQASDDKLGLKVKLPNGNVSGRILPVQIHDLYPEDKALIEKEMGGFLRSIEFIYKEPGVNKPLIAVDNEAKNLNKTTYRIQINKVANAIDEIIHGLRSQISQEVTKEKPILQTKQQTSESKEGDASGKSALIKIRKSWLLISAAAIIIIAGLFVAFRIIEKRKKADDIAGLEKSIAVLPFVNDSPDKGNEYFCNGVMEEILNDLQKIKEFRVLSRTSVEQYRGSDIPAIPKIAKSLNVNYIVEGSVQKYGNTFKLRVQLIAAHNERHLWGDSYEQEVKDTKDIYKVQSSVAQSIAEELKASITPEEQQLIQKSQSISITAHDFYMQARNEHLKFWMDFRNIVSLNNAITLYRRALQSDPSYAQAYSGLGMAFVDKFNYQHSTEANYPDSMKIYSDKALKSDNKLDEAYLVKGIYYDVTGEWEKSLKAYDEAIRINPNYALAYIYRGNIFAQKIHDVYAWLDDDYKAITLELGPQLPKLMRALGVSFGNMGVPEKGRYYLEEALKLDNDSVNYYDYLSLLELSQTNFDLAISLEKKNLNLNQNNAFAHFICLLCYSRLGKYEDSYRSALEYLKIEKDLGLSFKSGYEYIGYAFWMTGHKEEAMVYFNKQIDLYSEALELDPNDPNISASLAGVYSFLGDTEKAFQIFDRIQRKEPISESKAPKVASLSYYNQLKYDPLFENMRKESSFQEYLKTYENVYNRDHEHFLKWLTEQGKL